jgi:crotonobetainyl-CoA:carnitine CoA-transferase CaiB-like acyl-CoA transferase
MIVDVEDKDIGIVKLAGNPIKLSDCEDENYRNEAPEIGQHNKEILSNLLGLSEDELKNLKDEGVI